MLVRVLEIPPPTGNYHFGGGEPQVFMEVDWFRDDPGYQPLTVNFQTEEGVKLITDFIKRKKYYNPKKAYLVLHPVYPFTINYTAG